MTSEAGTQRNPRWCHALRAWVAIASAVALAAAPAGASAAMRAGVIDHVADGDTVVLRGGETIRLVQIDTPEVYGDTECYGPTASAVTKATAAARDTRARGDRSRDSISTTATAARWPTSGRALRSSISASYATAMRRRTSTTETKAATPPRSSRQPSQRARRARACGDTAATAPCRFGRHGVSRPDPCAPRERRNPPATPTTRPACRTRRSDLDCRQVGHPVKVIGSDVYNLDGNGDGYGCE